MMYIIYFFLIKAFNYYLKTRVLYILKKLIYIFKTLNNAKIENSNFTFYT